MNLVEDCLVPGPSFPIGMAPAIAGGIDDDACAMHVTLLLARGRIGNLESIRQFEAIAVSRTSYRHQLEPAIRRRFHGQSFVDIDQMDREAVESRRPKAKARMAGLRPPLGTEGPGV